MSKPYHQHQEHTHPLIWCAAIICTILTVAVIITGMVVFIGYLAYRPNPPFVNVTYAHLDLFSFDQAGVLSTRLTIVMAAQNNNKYSAASFSEFRYVLTFGELEVARLAAHPFDVQKNHTLYLNYLVESSHMPLDPQRVNFADTALKNNRIAFWLKGHARSRWMVGPIVPVRTWCKLDCKLQFEMDGSSIGSHCSSNTM